LTAQLPGAKTRLAQSSRVLPSRAEPKPGGIYELQVDGEDASDILLVFMLSWPSVAQNEVIKFAVSWDKVLRVSQTTPTLQVVVNPLLRRGTPVHDKAFQALQDLGAAYLRYVPWLPYPKLGVAELDHTRLYDEVVTAMRRVQPDMRFVGLALALETEPHYFEYFLNHKNHKPGVPLDFISYHFYADAAADETPALEQFTYFDQAEGFLKTVR